MPDEPTWFSAKVRLVCFVESAGARYYMDVIHVFRAVDWQDAMQRAIALGRDHEQTYTNADGHKVSWRLKEVLTLDMLLAPVLDGAEVNSALLEIPPGEAESLVEDSLRPQDSQPTQTL